jgi:hypothetical protein
LIGSASPPYQCDTFDSYDACITTAQAQAETLPDNTVEQAVHWDYLEVSI